MSEVCGKMSGVLIAGNIEEIKKLVQEALDWGIQAQEILERGLLPRMDVVGRGLGLMGIKRLACGAGTFPGRPVNPILQNHQIMRPHSLDTQARPSL